jgi:uncharacterized protein
MSELVKPSRFNHVVASDNGEMLAFNALSCGFASIDEENQTKFVKLSADKEPFSIDQEDDKEFNDNLVKGGFVVPEHMDEMDTIRAMHYRARFSESACGMTIIPTLNCNFACDYCYENEEMHTSTEKSRRNMSETVQESIVALADSKIRNDSAFTVTWYGGEPLLRPQIVVSLTERFKEICDRKNSQYFAGIITNGYLLTSENTDFLAKNGVNFCQITIDGAREVHDSRRPLRGGGKTYDRIVDNLANISDKVPISFSIRVNVDSRNKDSVEDLLVDLKNRGFDSRKNISLYFGQVLHYSSSCRDISRFCMVSEEFADFQIQAYRLALELGFRITMYPAAMYGNCGAISASSIIVEPSGSVHNCWNTVGVEQLKTGELTKDGVDYNGRYMKWLGWMPFRDECNDCNVLPLCMGGCPYKSLYPSEVTDAPNNTCTWWKYNLPRMLDLYCEANKRGLLCAHNQPEHNIEESRKEVNE